MGAHYVRKRPTPPRSTTSTRGTWRARDARLIARCTHENIVEIHQAIEAHGRSFMVLEYLDGVTLRDKTNERWQHARIEAATTTR